LIFRPFAKDTVQLTIPVTSGTIQEDLYDANMNLIYNISQVTITDPVTLSGDVPLQYIQGNLKPDETGGYPVYFDVSKGLWTLELSDGNASANSAIMSVFQTNGFKYKVTTISAQVYTDSILELRPKQFRMATFDSRTGQQTLSLFIVTVSDQPNAATFNLNDPLPKNYDTVMFISNNITTGKMAKDGFQKSTTAWTMTVVPPPNHKTFTGLKCSSGILAMQFVAPDPNLIRISKDSNIVNVDLSTMALESSNPYATLSYAKTWTQKFQYNATHTRKDFSFRSWDDFYASVTVSFKVQIPLNVAQSDGSTLTLQINVDSSSISVTGDVDSSGACTTNQHDVQTAFINGLSKDLPPKLATILNGIKWDGVSVLALKSILFPGKYMKFEKGYTPGDMVLAGSLSDPQ